jgi:hypothetical protein
MASECRETGWWGEHDAQETEVGTYLTRMMLCAEQTIVHFTRRSGCWPTPDMRERVGGELPRVSPNSVSRIIRWVATPISSAEQCKRDSAVLESRQLDNGSIADRRYYVHKADAAQILATRYFLNL